MADRLRDFGPELRVPGEADDGERSFGGRRPYHFLPREVLGALANAAEMAPWPAEFRRTTTLRERERIIRDCLDKSLLEGWTNQQAAAYIENRVKKISTLVDRYEFVFPLDNVDVHHELNLTLGPIEIRPLGSDLWERFTNDVVRTAVADGEPVGPRAANGLYGEEALRAPRWTNGYVSGCMVVKARGLPHSAYASAREHALFGLAALAANGDAHWEHFGHYIALSGEQIDRKNAVRFRFATADLRPDHIIDGIGPSLPMRISPGDDWPLVTAASDVLSVSTPSDAAKRVARSIFWLGHTLNQPTFFEREAEELGPEATDQVLRPTRVEVGLRIRTLITAVEASFKEDSESTDEGKARFGRALRKIDGKRYGDTWQDICDAYEARHDWTHAGSGPGRRAAATALARGLQSVLPTIARHVRDTQPTSFAEMHSPWNES